MSRWFVLIALLFIAVHPATADDAPALPRLDWTALPDLPNELGVAGPFVGVHYNPEHPQDEVLVVAGGANFPTAPGGDIWEADKVWHDEAWVLTRSETPEGNWKYAWLAGFALDRPRAYGAVVSTRHGVVCMGGNDAGHTFDDCFLLQWDPEARSLRQTPLPSLSSPCAFGAATIIGDVIYLAGGQSGSAADTEMKNFWSLDLSALDKRGTQLEWQVLPAWPGSPRVGNLTVAQNNGTDTCVYVISGRHNLADKDGLDAIDPLVDVYEFNPKYYDPDADDFGRPWRRRADAPIAFSGGTGMAVGPSLLFAVSGIDLRAIVESNRQKDDYPGFPRAAFAYETTTDTWVRAGTMPLNQLTSPAVPWDGSTFLISGEIRPRVRTAKAWRITPHAPPPSPPE